MHSVLLAFVFGAASLSSTIELQLNQPHSSTPALMLGTLSEPMPGDLGQASLMWAMSHRDELQLPANSTLRFKEGFRTQFGGSVHLQQQVNGIDVYGAQVVVTFDQQRRVVQVSSSVATYDRTSLRTTFDTQKAIEVAAQGLRFVPLNGQGHPVAQTREAFFKVGNELHSGYFIQLVSVNPLENLYAAVDAASGKRLWVQNRIYHSGDPLAAKAYPISPGGLDAGVGITPTIDALLTHGSGTSMVTPTTDGHLIGDQLDAYNCCLNAGCVSGAAPKRYHGTLFGYIPINLVECDRQQVASNKPSLHASGDFVYTPIDPPSNTSVVDINDPANTDPFAEVHAFYQVNRVFDWARSLSSKATSVFSDEQPALETFKMRDEKRVPARKPAVWANFFVPNVNRIQAGQFTVDDFIFIDNAAFVPKEQFDQITQYLPDYVMDVDTLLIFQGSHADASYDASVLWHEFGHGIVYATAGLDFQTVSVDAYSSNNEGGALHEGFADFISAAFGQNPDIGQYFGPRVFAGVVSPISSAVRTDAYLRTLNNTLSCPSLLWGEVHQDSQHVSAALWQARQKYFLGSDNGNTFDASFYAALVSMAPNTNFDTAAATISAHVQRAFPSMSPSLVSSKLNAMFDLKGVTHCDKVIDVTDAKDPRPYYGIAADQSGGITSGNIPGPYQMKLKFPKGGKSLTLKANVQATAQSALGGGPTNITLLASLNKPVKFTTTGTAISSDAQWSGNVTGTSVLEKTITVDVPCGGELFFTIAAPANTGATISAVAITGESADLTCGSLDAGTPAVDAGTSPVPVADAGTDGTGGAPAKSGCASAPSEMLWIAIAAALWFSRRSFVRN